MRSDTRTMRSTGAKTRATPGPLACSSTRPRRKMTPRSYSARILIDEITHTPMMIQKMMIHVENSNGISASRFFRHRFHSEVQSIDGRDADALAGFERRRRHSIPVFAANQDAALGGEITDRHANLANHAFTTCDHFGRAGSDNEH